MATPVAHVLVGLAVSYAWRDGAEKRTRILGWWCAGAAVAPDLDFLPGLLQGQPALYHQGISHSLGFAVATGLVLALAWRARGIRIIKYGALFSLACATHLLLDVFAPDARPPYGIPVFWPASSETYLAPISILWGMRHAGQTSATTAEWLAGIADPYNVGAIGVELLVTVPLVLVMARFGKRRADLAGLTGKG